MRPELLLRRIEEEQARHAREAMERPQDGDVFAHGRAVGIYSGLDRMKQIILELLADDDRKGSNL